MSRLGTQWLDVAIGLAFIYIVLSLLASAIVELLETLLRTRAKYLWQGLGALLGEPVTDAAPRGAVAARAASGGVDWLFRLASSLGQVAPQAETGGAEKADDHGAPARPGAGRGKSHRKQEKSGESNGHPPAKSTAPASLSVTTLYKHPLIDALFYGTYDNATKRLMRRQLPSYIPRESFSTAVIDIVSRQHPTNELLSSIESLRRGIAAMPLDSPMRRALESMTRVAGDDISLVQRRIEAWYDTAMDSIAGWYKRHAQVTLFMVGLVMAGAANIDSWRIAKDLANNEPKRQALLASAGEFAASHDKAGVALRTEEMGAYLGLVAGSGFPARDYFSVFGWLVTAFAVSLGAPFWFDLLNKFMVVRSTVKPKEKSQDEGSADRLAPARSGAAAPPSTTTVFFK